MHESFQRALNPQSRHVVLRLPLVPLQLGHLCYLHELRSPVIRGEPFNFGELLTAILVCSWPHEKARRVLRRNLWLAMFAWFWGRRCAGLDIDAEKAKFECYLIDERALPPIASQPTGEGKTIGAPWEWVLIDLLCSTYRMTEREALNTPVRKANALWAIHNDAIDRISLATAPATVASVIHGIWERMRKEKAA